MWKSSASAVNSEGDGLTFLSPEIFLKRDMRNATVCVS